MATILLIDDDEAFRSMLRRVLQRVGHNVIEATEGGAALRALSGATVDLVITDIIMPGKEGVETIIALRRNHPGVKVFAMSGGGHLGAESHLQMAQNFGAVRVFTKPIDNEELCVAVEDVLG